MKKALKRSAAMFCVVIIIASMLAMPASAGYQFGTDGKENAKCFTVITNTSKNPSITLKQNGISGEYWKVNCHLWGQTTYSYKSRTGYGHYLISVVPSYGKTKYIHWKSASTTIKLDPSSTYTIQIKFVETTLPKYDGKYQLYKHNTCFWCLWNTKNCSITR